MEEEVGQIKERSFMLLDKWLQSCTRRKRLAKNTIAVGIVILDHLRAKCPVSRDDVMSGGGEVRGSRSGLGRRLELHGITPRYLKEVASRQAHQDGQRLLDLFEWGNLLVRLSDSERGQLLRELTDRLVSHAKEHLSRENLRLSFDHAYAPPAWINLILEEAKGKSGGVVEQHLVGAKLEKRYGGDQVPNHPAHAADVQTGRPGDFAIHNTVYHVTGAPSMAVVRKCAENLRQNRRPVLLVPNDKRSKAVALAEEEGVDARISVVSIEDFLAINIIEISGQEEQEFFEVFREILDIYNRRLSQVETDMSLCIELR